MIKFIFIFLLFFFNSFFNPNLSAMHSGSDFPVSLLFDRVKDECLSSRDNYIRFAHLLFDNAGKGGCLNSFQMETLKIELMRDPEPVFLEFAQRVAQFLDVNFPVVSVKQDCVICQEEPTGLKVLLSCRHAFCYSCLFEWFAGHDPDVDNDAQRCCPICRKNIDACFKAMFQRDKSYDEIMERNTQRRRQLRAIEEQELFARLQQSNLGNILQMVLQARFFDLIMGNRRPERDGEAPDFLEVFFLWD